MREHIVVCGGPASVSVVSPPRLSEERERGRMSLIGPVGGCETDWGLSALSLEAREGGFSHPYLNGGQEMDETALGTLWELHDRVLEAVLAEDFDRAGDLCRDHPLVQDVDCINFVVAWTHLEIPLGGRRRWTLLEEFVARTPEEDFIADDFIVFLMAKYREGAAMAYIRGLCWREKKMPVLRDGDLIVRHRGPPEEVTRDFHAFVSTPWVRVVTDPADVRSALHMAIFRHGLVEVHDRVIRHLVDCELYGAGRRWPGRPRRCFATLPT